MNDAGVGHVCWHPQYVKIRDSPRNLRFFEGRTHGQDKHFLNTDYADFTDFRHPQIKTPR